MSAITTPAHVKMCVPTQKALTHVPAVIIMKQLLMMVVVLVKKLALSVKCSSTTY